MLNSLLRAWRRVWGDSDIPKHADAEDQSLPREQLASEQALTEQQRAEAPFAPPQAYTAPPPVEPRAIEPWDYTLPTLDLLDEIDFGARSPADPAKLESVQQTLIDTLGQFGVAVAPGDITRGPTITSYELYPARGVRLGQIRSLERDLARVTRAERISKIAPVPGKQTIAIDLPNQERFLVSARETFQSVAWAENQGSIPLALGRNTRGDNVIADLALMPHLLIGGMPGSGKSSCLDAIIVSLLFRFTPEELRLILIDTHYSQMQIYGCLPHLIIPVITDPKKVLLALKHVAIELNNRNHMFAATGVEDIAAFNSTAVTESRSLADGTSIPNRLPYLVVVIDELTDLCQSARPEVEGAIESIIESSAVAGIHFVMASKPAFGKLRAVLMARAAGRIALQVRTEDESFSIIDEAGAERLLGNGDMLCRTGGDPLAERVQAALVTDNEVRRVIEFVSAQTPPSYKLAIESNVSGRLKGDAEKVTAEDEDLLEQCIEIIRQGKCASTSLLQRRLRLGYTRAAHMIDILEQRGILGPGEGVKPREILVDLDSA